jgi:hypothetical protein
LKKQNLTRLRQHWTILGARAKSNTSHIYKYSTPKIQRGKVSGVLNIELLNSWITGGNHMNYQQKIICQYLWDCLCRNDDNPFDDLKKLEEYVVKNIRCINQDESLAIDLEDEQKPIKKLDGFADLSSISSDADIIHYRNIEERFYEYSI